MPTKPPYQDGDYDPELTKYVNEHLENNGRFCAPEIFLSVPVQDRTGELHAVEDRQKVAIVDGEGREAYRGHALQVAERLLKAREYCFFSQFIRPGVWSRDVTGGATTDYGRNQVKKWVLANTDANPLGDIIHLVSEMGERQHGHRPNKICMARDVWDEFVDHPKILSDPRMRGIDGDGLSVRRAAAALFGVDEVLIMELLNIKKGFLFLFHQGRYSPLQKLNSPTAGVNFVWKPSNVDVTGADPWIWNYRSESRNHVAARYSSDFKITSKDCGTLIENLV